jgi:hypothetical protein
MSARCRSAALAALFALVLQTLLPVAASLAAPVAGDVVVICSTDGLKVVRLDSRGVPSDEAPAPDPRGAHCDHCLPGQSGAVALPFGGSMPLPAQAAALRSTPLDRTAPTTTAVNRYRPRAPPTTV